MTLNKKATFYTFAFLCIAIGLYPSMYFLIDRQIGILDSKSAELLQDASWNIGFYTHIALGGFALLIGWTQFSERLRRKHLKLHRMIGKLYVVSALISGLSSIFIAFYATGGLVSIIGFMSLGVLWVFTTLKAYLLIKNREIQKHQVMMIYSFSLCFAAVMLRLWLPILIGIFGDFESAYRVVAWLCWVPNLIVAYFITRRVYAK